MIEPHLAVMCELQEMFGIPVSHVLSPPPLDTPDITPFLPSALQQMNRHGVVPPHLRLRLYRMQSRIFCEYCEDSGIGIIKPPVETCMPTGYLKRNFRGGNATHASVKYGGLVLAQMLEAASG